MQDPRYPSHSAMGTATGSAHNVAVGDSITVAPASHQPMDHPSAALLRLMRRRVPPEKRQRTEMSCDWCKKKRCKCLRGSTIDTCRACSEIGRPCTTTEPRKRRVYGSISTASVLAAASTSPIGSQQQAQAQPQKQQPQQQQQQQQKKQQNRPKQQRTLSVSSIGLPSNTTGISDVDPFAASTAPASSASASSTSQPLSPFSLGNGIDGFDDMSLDVSMTDPRLLVRPPMLRDSTGLPLTVSPRDIISFRKDDLLSASTAPPLLTPSTSTFYEKKQASDEHLFEDALGHPRYIGPLGSYTLLGKLWEVMSVWCAPSATTQAPQCVSTQTASPDQTVRPRFGSTSSISDSTIMDGADQTIQQHSTGRSIGLPPREVADVLVGLYFDKVHCDFPIFRRSLFQASYEITWASPMTPSQSPHLSDQPATVGPEAEPAWLMCLSMVFVLGLEAASAQSSAIRRLVGNTAHREALKARYLARVQELLPQVIAGSMLVHVQALMLYCRYLHITRSRNACWNLTGAAIRVAVAIGLHRNGVHGKCSPAERELRRRIWWTLYAFERIECSSLGRTSAIDDTECNAELPVEDLLDTGDISPRGYVGAHSGLMRLLGSICKQQYSSSCSGNGDGDTDNGEESSSSPGNQGPLEQADLAAATAESLDLWFAQLPQHLSLPALSAEAPKSHQRATLLLHVQYHYTVTLLCRPFLLALVSKTKPGSPAAAAVGDDSPSSQTLLLFARKCIEAAKSAVAVIERLFRAGLFNSKTWWDVYFIEASCMILAMGRFVQNRDLRNDAGIINSLRICIRILKECKEFSPTMQRIASVTTDFAQTLVSSNSATQDEQDALRKKSQQQQNEQYLAQQHQKYLQQQQQDLYQRQGQYGFERQLSNLQSQSQDQIQNRNRNHSQQQHSPILYSGSQTISGGSVLLAQDLEEFSGEMRSRSASSRSGSSPDESFVPVGPGNIFGAAHDTASASINSSSGITQDPFSMPWNMADISQLWGDWAEPDHWWQTST